MVRVLLVGAQAVQALRHSIESIDSIRPSIRRRIGRFASSSRNSSAVGFSASTTISAPRMGRKRAQRCAHDRASSSKRSFATPNTGSPHDLTVVAGYVLMACAAMAWYVMAHLIFADVFGRDVCRWVSPGSISGGSSRNRSYGAESKKRKWERDMRAGKVFAAISLASSGGWRRHRDRRRP